MSINDIQLYHRSHQVTRHITGEKYSRSCSRCKATDLLGNEALSQLCLKADKKYGRPEDLEGPDCLVSKVIFGIDGVLSDVSHRSHNDNNWLDMLGNTADRKEWEDGCFEDGLIESQLNLINNLIKSNFYSVEIWTQRTESAREFTELWLTKAKVDQDCLRLRMCPANDSALPEKTFEDWLDIMEIKPVLVYHSNPNVIKMFQKRGISAALIHPSASESV